jgi:hypothetical protein
LRTLVERDLNRTPNALRILNDFVRPESQNLPSLAFHGGGTARISLNLKRMMFTVDLDDEVPGYASKVGKVRTDRVLSTELHAADPAIAQEMPADAFGATAVASQLASF